MVGKDRAASATTSAPIYWPRPGHTQRALAPVDRSNALQAGEARAGQYLWEPGARVSRHRRGCSEGGRAAGAGPRNLYDNVRRAASAV